MLLQDQLKKLNLFSKLSRVWSQQVQALLQRRVQSSQHDASNTLFHASTCTSSLAGESTKLNQNPTERGQVEPITSKAATGEPASSASDAISRLSSCLGRLKPTCLAFTAKCQHRYREPQAHAAHHGEFITSKPE